MPQDHFVQLLLTDFTTGYGSRLGKVVVACNLYSMAIDLATEKQQLLMSATNRHKVAFRAAYALEHAFFIDIEYFMSYLHLITSAFPKAKNRSVHRHFCKIISTLLRTKRLDPTVEQASMLAETAALWLSDPKSKVAVKVLSFDILCLLAPRVQWAAEIIPDAVGLLSNNPTPGIQVRLNRSQGSI